MHAGIDDNCTHLLGRDRPSSKIEQSAIHRLAERTTGDTPATQAAAIAGTLSTSHTYIPT